MADLAVRPTADLSGEELRVLRGLLDEAFGGSFTDDDWHHTTGGLHVLVQRGSVTMAHAAVVPRTLVANDRSLPTGYVEGVATSPGHRHRGHATRAMRAAATVIARIYDIGTLSTGSPGFYTRLGWESWRGPTYVHTPEGRQRTVDEDAGVMVLRTDRTHDLDLGAELTCDWRPGDVW